MKATFQLTLLLEEEEVALFNTQLANDTSIDPASGLRIWEFEPTPVMSTYIVAWAIGESPLSYSVKYACPLFHHSCLSASFALAAISVTW